MKSKGKKVSLGYFISFDGFNEFEYCLILMNSNSTYKWDLIFVEIIFYSIFAFLKFIQT